MNALLNLKALRNEIDSTLPLVVSYGMGVDSTAVLVGMWLEGIRPDAILFSNVGSEKDETYDYLDHINAWCRSVGFPEITVVKYTPKRFKYNPYSTLGGNCISNRTLPSLAFGRKSCSLKWKGGPLDKKVNELFGDAPVYRAIGYDCSAADNKRFAHAQKATTDGSGQSRENDHFIYPLQVWGWTRDVCIEMIEAVGLQAPPKSSCTFCPAMKAHEVEALPVEKLLEIVIMEANASPNLRTVKGLWRGKSMTDFVRSEKLVPEWLVDHIWEKWGADERFIQDDVSSEEHIERAINAYLKLADWNGGVEEEAA